MIELALAGSILIPFATALLFAAWPLTNERLTAWLALAASALSAAASALAIGGWLAHLAAPVRTAPHLVFDQGSYRFTFELVLDGAAVVFLVLVQFVTGMVMRFSRFYLHREPGFQRFFATVLLFQAAMCLLTLAGNLDLMFAGWEMVGISSFLLIAFYRERPSAVRSALKTYSVYRVADIGMLLAACLEETGRRSELGLLVLLAAMGKSAQFPFSFWVARAMEGPTPSSALFYGALSVHAGAYLLLRTFDIWGAVTAVRISVGLVGIVTAILCSMFSRVQPTIKAQIGYASVTQVGLIFAEIALGLTHLALLHIVSNAIFRCYQLLVSPSVVAHRLRRQATAGAARAASRRSFYERVVPARFWPTLYVFALSEGYLKDLLKTALWAPLRRIAPKREVWIGLGLCAAAASLVLGRGAPALGAPAMAIVLMLLAALFSACGLGAWRQPARAVAWISGSSFFAAAAVYATPSSHAGPAVSFYAMGIALSCALGLAGVGAAVSSGRVETRFSGLWANRPIAASVALVGALGLAGFPLLPTFLGEDLLVRSALANGQPFSTVLSGLLALNGYLAVRNFALTFFGRADHPQPGPAETPLHEPTVPPARIDVARS